MTRIESTRRAPETEPSEKGTSRPLDNKRLHGGSNQGHREGLHADEPEGQQHHADGGRVASLVRESGPPERRSLASLVNDTPGRSELHSSVPDRHTDHVPNGDLARSDSGANLGESHRDGERRTGEGDSFRINYERIQANRESDARQKVSEITGRDVNFAYLLTREEPGLYGQVQDMTLLTSVTVESAAEKMQIETGKLKELRYSGLELENRYGNKIKRIPMEEAKRCIEGYYGAGKQGNAEAVKVGWGFDHSGNYTQPSRWLEYDPGNRAYQSASDRPSNGDYRQYPS